MKKFYKFLLKIALRLNNFLYRVISFLAIKSEGGLHPKHRLINYHQFFTSHITENDKVLDIGCGNGSLAYDLARKAKFVKGIDILEKNILKARKKYSLPNIEYVAGDAPKDLDEEKFDVIVLSNVLEHIENRLEFLKKIKNLAPKILIRVPMHNRDWMTLYKKELGVESRLDLTHYIEYTKETFEQEINGAGLKIADYSVQFGEILAVVFV